MSKHSPFRWFGSLILATCMAAPQVRAQTVRAPDAYAVSEVNSMTGQTMVMRIIRDGPKAMVEIGGAQLSGGTLSAHTRTYYDLEKRRVYGLDLNQPAKPCSAGNFSGEWDDPFERTAGILAELAKQNPREAGTATINGFATKVLEAGAPGPTQARVWVDSASGLIIKAQSGALIMLEVKQLSIAKPPAGVLDLPASCAAVPFPKR